MERYSYLTLTHLLHTSPLSLFNLKTLKQTLCLRTESALYPILKKLIEAKILEEITPGLYQDPTKSLSDFLVANILVKQSYISFETALNMYSILSQGPQITTSATLQKTQVKETSIGTFSYNHISQPFYFGFVKQGNYLIARPEKALIDYIYIRHKRGITIDMDEWDFSIIKTGILNSFLKQIKTTQTYPAVIKILKEQTPCLQQTN